ncbi:hypothetical protein [Sulfolobus spindle-shaped virus]|uniref:Uncharacterized protein n=1 Tax=Saccharolobus islandicus (strain M.14.25 / Kamchatka \|nr:hypothetical protein [Sulfolobus islandicus]ACP38583.1 hypothetical protein M1425_1838 [Sulfolobus islandicus M.14.25]AZG03272.1 hypothetical protein [Sulfolobus spindle-shaped virus]
MSDRLLEKLFKSKSKKTRIFSVRIPAKIYLLYELAEFDSEDITELKQLVSAFIVSKAIEKGIEVPDEVKSAFQNVVSKSTQNGNIVFNINISKSESKSEVNNNITIDLSDLINKLNELWNEVKVRNRDIQRNNAVVLPPARIKEFDELIAKIMKKLVN